MQDYTDEMLEVASLEYLLEMDDDMDLDIDTATF